MRSLRTLYQALRRSGKGLRLFLVIAGPGIVTMVANNDAGGITTYALTGARYGYHLIWLMLLLIPAVYVIQEMTVRLGAVSKRGLAEAVFAGFGPFWGWFSLVDLFLIDRLTVVSEFAGMTAALGIFGIPAWITVSGVCVLMGGIALFGRYWTWEKIALLFCAVNIVYIPAAFMMRPRIADIIAQGLSPNLPDGLSGQTLFFLLAIIGTTLAPWMLFFQQSSVVDKGLREKDIPWAQGDTLIGAVFTMGGAVLVVIVTASGLQGADFTDAVQAARLLLPAHPMAGTLLAIGLFDAGLLGALCVSLTSSWAFGEIFGWAHSLNDKIRQAPWFYVTCFLTLVSAGGLVLIPGAPLVLIILFIQVAAVTLLPTTLVFLLVLLNDRKSMGRHTNTPMQNGICIAITIAIVALATLYGVSILVPQWFGGSAVPDFQVTEVQAPRAPGGCRAAPCFSGDFPLMPVCAVSGTPPPAVRRRAPGLRS